MVDAFSISSITLLISNRRLKECWTRMTPEVYKKNCLIQMSALRKYAAFFITRMFGYFMAGRSDKSKRESCRMAIFFIRDIL